MKTFLLAAAALFVAASPAAAADVLYENDFDSENGGATAVNYTGFDGLTVSDGSVDLVHTGDGFNITCVTGGCVDLDGSTGDSGVLTSDSFGYDAIRRFSLAFDISGSQVGGAATDGVIFGFNFDAPTTGSFTFRSASGASFGDTFTDLSSIGIVGSQLPSNFPFDNVVFSFRTNGTGNFNFFLDGESIDPADSNNDNIGLIVDNVSLVSAVPEPATWAMMIMGFGLVGGAMRRRALPAQPSFA